MKKPALLIVDDEKNTREGLRRALAADYRVALAANAAAALERLETGHFDAVLTDLRMPGLNGIQFLQRLQALPQPPISIMLTAYGSIETAVEAMRAGAYDYLTKPVNLDTLELVLGRALEARTQQRFSRARREPPAAAEAVTGIVGRSAAMQEIFATLRQIAPARSTVLLAGESGTGKELIARALHQLGSRADKPFVAVHCAALPATLLQSELFGHEKGAFTNAVERRIGRFEAADGGTLFLDEIGEIDPAVQITLLRFLETRTFERVGDNQPVEVDVRLVAATNRDLRQLVSDGVFREDLYYRLDVLHLRMPPLRERREDIPLLLDHYLALFNDENAKQIRGLSPAAMAILSGYEWPGNVRELRNCVERMVVMTNDAIISPSNVPAHIRAAAEGTAPATAGTLELQANQRHLIVQALHEAGGNRTAAARRLGISRRTLHRKLNEFGLRDV